MAAALIAVKHKNRKMSLNEDMHNLEHSMPNAGTCIKRDVILRQSIRSVGVQQIQQTYC